MDITQLCEQVKKIYGDNLISIILYGSAASGDYHKKYSDHNILIVLKKITLAELKNISPLARTWKRQGNPPPLLFTVQDITSSLDVFPIEFTDMQESHTVLYGEDIFKTITVDPRNIRLQCEHELKGKYIKLKESYIITQGKPAEVLELIVRSLSTFQIIFRHILRLKNGQAPIQKNIATKQLIAQLSLDASVFDTIGAVRDNPRLKKDIDVDNLIERYMQQISAVIDYIDAQ